MIECWLCPKSTGMQCKKEKKYCRKYTKKVSEGYIPNTTKKYEELRKQEIDYWDKKSD